jgi:predicted CopG family antitoxin
MEMAVKTITIDTEAYARLKKHKRANESFSETIKRVVPKPFDLEAWLKKMEGNEFGADMVKAVEEAVRDRRKGINRERRRAVS